MMAADGGELKQGPAARAGAYAALFDPPNYNEAKVKKSANVERLEQRIEVPALSPHRITSLFTATFVNVQAEQ